MFSTTWNVDCSNQAEGKDTRLAVVKAAMNLQDEQKSRVPRYGMFSRFDRYKHLPTFRKNVLLQIQGQAVQELCEYENVT